MNTTIQQIQTMQTQLNNVNAKKLELQNKLKQFSDKHIWRFELKALYKCLDYDHSSLDAINKFDISRYKGNFYNAACSGASGIFIRDDYSQIYEFYDLHIIDNKVFMDAMCADGYFVETISIPVNDFELSDDQYEAKILDLIHKRFAKYDNIKEEQLKREQRQRYETFLRLKKEFQIVEIYIPQ